MATNLNISENQERVPLRVGGGGLLRTITPDNGSPYYVGARAYVTQTAGGAVVTVIDKDGTTTATILNGTNGTNGQDGNGIADISKTGSSANVDEYTITYDDGTTETFYVTNGIDGTDGVDGVDGYSPSATVSKVGTTATITITDKDGTTTAQIHDGGASAFVAEFNVTTYADVKDAYDNDAILICTADDSGNTKIFQLAYFDDGNNIFYFAEPTGDGWDIASVSENDGWDNGTIQFASTDVATQLRDGLMSALDWQKLDGIESGAEVNVQSDWNQSVNTEDDYIKNKPTIPTKVSDLSNDSGYITSPNVVYCTCSTAGGTAAKVATIESGSLTSLNEGDQAIVKFTNANSVASPTLQVGTTTAKSIKRYGTTAPSTSAATSWNAGSAILFVYDGTYWQQIGFLNSTYSEISQTNITNGSGSSTGLVTGRRAKAAVEAFAPIKDVTVDGTSVLSGTTAAIDLSGKSDVGHTHTKSEITDFPALAAVATTGNYNSLTDKPAIHNVPSGGSSGQVLSKASGTDYDLAWVNQSGGGGTPIPTADTVAEFDSSACMNSSDMSAQDISDFVDALDVGKDYAIINDSVPIGAIEAFAGSTAPYGWLICDGSAVSRTTYDKLFEAIGTTYGSGDGSTTFNIPDLRGRVAMGAGTGTATDATAHTLGSTGGAETHKLTTTEMPSHTHGHYYYGGSGASWGYNYSNGSSTKSAATEAASGIIPNGGGGAHNNLQPYTVANYIIKAFNKDLAQAEPSIINTMADFIVDQGTSGIWTYRKWESGIAECWCGTSKTATAAQTEFTLYYPSGLFTSVTAVTANGSVTGNINSGVRYTSTSTTFCDIWITAEVTGTATINVHAIGKWK